MAAGPIIFSRAAGNFFPLSNTMVKEKLAEGCFIMPSKQFSQKANTPCNSSKAKGMLGHLRLAFAAAAAAVLVSSTPALAAVHTVVPGETLWRISKLYGTTVEEIQRMNGLNGDLIFPGQKLTVPDKNVSAATTTDEVPQSESPSRPAAELSSRGGEPHERSNSLLTVAKSFLGRPYRYGGSGPNAFDCSGFTAYVFAQFGYELPHNSAEQAKLGRPVERADLAPGDLVFFGYYGSSDIRHVGICVGGNSFIHASTSGGVKYSSLAEPYYAGNYKGARRLL
jgi:peptidoglycan endopeptidase LytE